MARYYRPKNRVPSWHLRKASYRDFLDGHKCIFLFPATAFFIRLERGMDVHLMNGSHRTLCRVVAKRFYRSLEEAVEHEDLEKICHGDAAQVLGSLDRVYHHSIWDSGAYAFEFVVINNS